MRVFRRLKAYKRRILKERSEQWMPRLDAAFKGCWARLEATRVAGTFNEKKLRHFERHMRRLTKLTLPATRLDHLVVSLIFFMPITLFPPARHYPLNG